MLRRHLSCGGPADEHGGRSKPHPCAYVAAAATVIRAGVVEEIIFRGLAIERLAALTGSRAMAAIVSGAAFIAVHISGWGYAQLIVVAFGTVIMTVLYLWRRDLGSNMIAHTLTDFVGFLLARLQGA